ncbi:MAG: GtrA family protein [Clostridia bacterium]|nr:GtrA family protein [Clostridia bacterium]
MDTIIELIKKYKSVISYLFFGVCTTVINMATYYLCYNVSGIPNVPSTMIAWVVAVVFAYITNKLFVFDSKSFKADVLVREVASFFGCRLLTGILDVIIMYVAVDVMDMNSTLWKLVSNVLVIILNYVASKLVIFKKK